MTGSQFQNLVVKYRNLINEVILSELSNRKPKSLYNPLIYFLKSGGKRLRAILLLLCANSIKNSNNKEPLNQAAAIELLHNFTLIHDDIMDNSDKRHNKTTIHKKYDLSTAILAGDALLALAYDFLGRDLNYNTEPIFKEFTKALTIVCEGQALDKEFESKKKVSLKNYFDMISMKTGALIKSACKIGALFKTNNHFVIEKLSKFGETLGIAFQIQDDLLDVISNESIFGKKKGSDLVEGKKTFLLLTALKKAKEKDLDKLNKLIENKGVRPRYIKDYIEIYRKLGILDSAKNEIQKFNKKAELLLDELENEINTQNLRHFLSLVINRQY